MVSLSFSLFATDSIPDNLVNPEDLVEFLLVHARRTSQSLDLVKGLGLAQGTTDTDAWENGLPTTEQLLTTVMQVPSLAGRTSTDEDSLRELAAKLVVSRFRSGSLGSYGLDF
jgi:hypothetical protein